MTEQKPLITQKQLKETLNDLQSRVGQATAIARSLAIVLDGQVLDLGMEPAEGCLGIADILGHIRDELVELVDGRDLVTRDHVLETKEL